MKKILYLISFLFAVALVGCEEKETPTPPAPATPSKIQTGAAENITKTSATLKGMVNVDIIDYDELVFGVLYSTKAEELVDFTAPSKNGLILIGNEFKVNVTELKADTKYYCRAYVMLNTLQILLGDVKEFTTLASSEEPETTFMFSVAENKTVTFSPGNLQYHPANDEWRFAPSQLDYIGDDNISETYNGWIDFFGWGTGNNPTNTSKDNDDYQTFVDWGVNKIGSDAPNTWRTLTYDEWYYLRNERPNYEKLIGVAQVNGVNGLILLPDVWACPSGLTFKSGFHDNYGTEYYAAYQTFSASDWTKLEASGAVFFPAAGYRYDSGISKMQYGGGYWSATEFLGGAWYLGVRSDGSGMHSTGRGYGFSVRLVKDN